MDLYFWSPAGKVKHNMKSAAVGSVCGVCSQFFAEKIHLPDLTTYSIVFCFSICFVVFYDFVVFSMFVQTQV